MAVNQRKSPRLNAAANSSGMPDSNSQVLDQHLLQILISIATLLLRNGYGFSRVNKLKKYAFVSAAKTLESTAPSRISIARIAAITGLTRIEVSQLLRSAGNQASSNIQPLNRAARVASGWASDPKFRNQHGEPTRLPFTSARSSFTSLVKKFSGDIPARAMLAEMKRLGLVRHYADDSVQLGKSRKTGSRLAVSAVRAIAPWAHFLSDVGQIGRMGELTSDARKLQLQFDSLPQILAATREIEKRRTIFVEGLRHLGSHTEGTAKYQLDVSIAVAIAATNTVNTTQQHQRHRRLTHESKARK